MDVPRVTNGRPTGYKLLQLLQEPAFAFFLFYFIMVFTLWLSSTNSAIAENLYLSRWIQIAKNQASYRDLN